MSEMEVVWQCLSTKLETKLALLIPVVFGLRRRERYVGGLMGLCFAL